MQKHRNNSQIRIFGTKASASLGWILGVILMTFMMLIWNKDILEFNVHVPEHT